MNADTMERFPPRTLGDAVRGYRPPLRVPNYENPAARMAREDGYALGLIDGENSVPTGIIFAVAFAVGCIVAGLIILLGSLALA